MCDASLSLMYWVPKISIIVSLPVIMFQFNYFFAIHSKLSYSILQSWSLTFKILLCRPVTDSRGFITVAGLSAQAPMLDGEIGETRSLGEGVITVAGLTAREA